MCNSKKNEIDRSNVDSLLQEPGTLLKSNEPHHDRYASLTRVTAITVMTKFSEKMPISGQSCEMKSILPADSLQLSQDVFKTLYFDNHSDRYILKQKPG
jgi:hypothetical protein